MSKRLWFGLVAASVAPFILQTCFILFTWQLDNYDPIWGWAIDAFCILVGVAGLSMLQFPPAPFVLVVILYVPVMWICLLLFEFCFVGVVYGIWP